MPPIRECAKINAVKVWQGKNGKIYDFGVNIAGYIGFKAKGKVGKTINFRYAEKLDKNGVEIDQSNIDFYIFGKKDDISKAIGKINKAVIGIKDKNLAGAIIKILSGGDVIG